MSAAEILFLAGGLMAFACVNAIVVKVFFNRSGRVPEFPIWLAVLLLLSLWLTAAGSVVQAVTS